MDKSLHTVTLDHDKCKGCIACMKRCPTEAIRVRNGKAKVHYDRCIGCGECVRMCPHQAKLPAYDPFESIFKYKYRIAVPAPSLFGQFNNLDDVNIVLNALLELGFDDVFEVARGAELVSEETRNLIREGKVKKPTISSACPAVLELIMMRYHSLMSHVIDLVSPADVALRLAREKAEQAGIPKEDIGVFFISPCPAKVYALKTGMGLKNPPADGVLSIGEMYFKLLGVMSQLKDKPLKNLSKTGILGVRWAASGGESLGIYQNRYLAADGMENINNVLKAMEDGTLNYIDFVELGACPSGCVGGVLNVENPFVARVRIRALRDKLPPVANRMDEVKKDRSFYHWETKPEVQDVYKLDSDFKVALEKMQKIEEIYKDLPHLDCGGCGAPSCRAFAEDVARGETTCDMCTRR